MSTHARLETLWAWTSTPTVTTRPCCAATRGARPRTRPATCCPTSGPASTCSTSAAARGRSRSTWPRGSRRAGSLGIDASADVVAQAQALGDGRVSFAVGDVYALDAADGSFDVVHAHQVLQHLTDPVAAVVEAHRVLRPDGILAVRDSDYAAFFWAPANPRLDRWLELYHQLTTRNRAEADAGRHLAAWVRAGGFSDVTVTSSTWTFADAAGRAWWGGMWADRVRQSAFATQAVEYGLSTRGRAGRPRRRLAASGSDERDGVFVVPSVEVIAHR